MNTVCYGCRRLNECEPATISDGSSTYLCERCRSSAPAITPGRWVGLPPGAKVPIILS